jgi:2-polyprenyl-3-methyl-5-hydroxy-6-metoxy-1,4-benzoquinol methylase
MGRFKKEKVEGEPAVDRHTIIDGHTFNTTQLKLNGHGRTLHRDYSAHFFRWSFVRRWIAAGSRVLDVGCGQELPLYRLLKSDLGAYRPVVYTGVDLNKILKKPTSQNIKVDILDQFNILKDADRLPESTYDVIVCLEVIEHMDQVDGQVLLSTLASRLSFGGHLYLSTPIFNGKAAKNHVHEYTGPELEAAILATGLTIERRFGTFTNLATIKKAETSVIDLADRLSDYFDDDAVSCICAPLMEPTTARNNLWVCKQDFLHK